MSRDLLIAQIEEACQLKQQLSASGITQYLNQILINCRPEPAPFHQKADPWQWGLVNKLIPALEQIARLRTEYSGPTSFWFTLPRGHDKTSFIGRLLNWLLAFSRITVDCVAAAADREQAGILADAMAAECRLNPWLQPFLHFKNYQVKGKNDSNLRILATDAKSNYGLCPDVIICDEITQWEEQDNWDSMMTGRRKKGKNAIVIVITNAGIQKTWQWDVMNHWKKLQKKNNSTYVYEAPGMICSWISPEQIAEDRQTTLPVLASRMYDNLWLDPTVSCGFVTREEAEACIDFHLEERHYGEKDKHYLAAIDYAAVCDRTALTIMHQEPDGTSIVDRLDILQGSKNRRVPIADVENWLDRARNNFNLSAVVIDPYQMESTIQKYQNLLTVIPFEYMGGKGNYELGTTLRSAIINKKLRFPRDIGIIQEHTFVDELTELIVKEMSYGWRLDHLPNLHDDRAVAVGMGLVHLLKHSFKKKLFEGEYFW